MAARLVTQVATDKELASLHALVDVFDVAENEIPHRADKYSDANIRFHQAIIGFSRCSLLVEMTDELFFHVRAIRQRTIFENERMKQSLVDHKNIIAALEARDTEGAERLVREHTLKLRDHVERYVDLE
jgi:DNA-binding GntR family transcriptional regulator